MSNAKESIIDENGYRANVGIILADGQGSVFWGRRVGHDAWQFPQGGMMPGECEEEAMYRELNEEVGLNPSDVKLIGATRGWLGYRLPRSLVRPRPGQDQLCIGQKQKWFLLHLDGAEEMIRLNLHEKPEFDRFRWVSYWYPVEQVVAFKRDVYRRAMRELSLLHSMLVRDGAGG
jgi:putative (di)nucleoside polyphosphate hydrolase